MTLISSQRGPAPLSRTELPVTSTPAAAAPAARPETDAADVPDAMSLTRKVLVGVGVALSSLAPVAARAAGSTSPFQLQLQGRGIALDTTRSPAADSTFSLVMRFAGSDSAQVSLPKFDSVAVAKARTSPEAFAAVVGPHVKDAAVLLASMPLATSPDSVSVAGPWRVLGERVVTQRRATHESTMTGLMDYAGSMRLTDKQQIAAVMQLAVARAVGGSSTTAPVVLEFNTDLKSSSLVKDGVSVDDRLSVASIVDDAMKAAPGTMVRVGPPGTGSDVLALHLGEGKLFVPGEGVVVDGAARLTAAVTAAGAQVLSTYVLLMPPLGL
jgi:hypothetical protein